MGNVDFKTGGESRPLRRELEEDGDEKGRAGGGTARGGRPIRRFLSCLQPTFASSLNLLRLCLRRVPHSPSRRSGYVFPLRKKNTQRNPLYYAPLSPSFTSSPLGQQAERRWRGVGVETRVSVGGKRGKKTMRAEGGAPGEENSSPLCCLSAGRRGARARGTRGKN